MNRYAKIILKHLWLLVLAALIGGGATYVMRTRQQKMFQSETRIFIGNSINSPDPELWQLDTGYRLAMTYAQLITYDLLNDVITSLELLQTPDELRGAVSTDVVPNTPILVVRVTYSDPQMAAVIADRIAETLIAYSPSNLTDEQQQRMVALSEQIEDLEDQISIIHQQSLDVLESLNLASAVGEETAVTSLNVEYDRLAEQNNASRSILAQLSDTYLNLSNRTNKLEIIERARPQFKPIGLNAMVVGIAGVVVAVALTAVALIYFESANNTLRTSDEVEEALALPVLARVSMSKQITRNPKTYLVAEKFPKSQIAEEYRNLRTNLHSLKRPHSNSVFLVTSATLREGKSVTVSNLAVSMANAGMRVLLIDADLRRPTVHDIFKLANIVGLTTLLAAEPEHNNGMNLTLEQVVQKTHIPGLWALTSGYSPTRTTEIFGSDAMLKLIDMLGMKYSFDIILMDTPPCLAVSDAAALAVGTAASVILVVNAGRTQRVSALKAKEQFKQLGVDLAGVVINRNRVREPGYSDPEYYSA